MARVCLCNEREEMVVMNNSVNRKMTMMTINKIPEISRKTFAVSYVDEEVFGLEMAPVRMMDPIIPMMVMERKIKWRRQ